MQKMIVSFNDDRKQVISNLSKIPSNLSTDETYTNVEVFVCQLNVSL